MSAKSKQIVPGGGVKTLVTVERLMGIAKSAGNFTIYDSSCPSQNITSGGQFPTLQIHIKAMRHPYLFVAFWAQEFVNNNNGAFILSQLLPFVDPCASVAILKNNTTKNDYLHVHKVRRGMATLNPAYYYDPLAFTLLFQNGGANYTMDVKNVIVGGCDDPTGGPMQVLQAGMIATSQNYSYSE